MILVNLIGLRVSGLRVSWLVLLTHVAEWLSVERVGIGNDLQGDH